MTSSYLDKPLRTEAEYMRERSQARFAAWLNEHGLAKYLEEPELIAATTELEEERR